MERAIYMVNQFYLNSTLEVRNPENTRYYFTNDRFLIFFAIRANIQDIRAEFGLIFRFVCDLWCELIHNRNDLLTNTN